MYTTGKEPKDTMWFRNIDNFINEINRFALLGTVTNKNGWLINNGIYYAGRLGKLHSTPTKGQQVVTDTMRIYPYLGEQYFVAAEQITTNYGGIDANGKTVNLDQIREEGKNIYRKRIRLMMVQLSLKLGIKLAKRKLNVYTGRQKRCVLNFIVQLVAINHLKVDMLMMC